MHPTTFERLDDLGKAGLLIGFTGGLLAVVPPMQALLTFQGSWQGPMVLMLLSLGMVAGVLLALSDSIALSGVVTAVTGVTIAVYGPVAPGILGVLGGALLYTAADEGRDAPSDVRIQRTHDQKQPPVVRR